MKILVTGGAGFIGSHIVDKYIELDHDVVIIDNLSTGVKKNINPKAKFYEMDINSKDVEDIFKEHKFDIINHHAAQMNVRVSVDDPIFDAKSNILGLLNLLNNAVKYEVKKFIFVSSGGVIYGDDVELPIIETAKKDPQSPYGISKITGEYYLKFFNKVHGLNFTTFRYANVYGPRQNPKGEAGVISIFTTKMLKNEQPIIFGDGKQTRDYVYVKDVVTANISALEKGNKEAFNIGTSVETNVNDLYDMVKSLTNYSKDVMHVEERAGELQRNALNTSKAKTLLDWEPKFNLNTGIKETIEWFKHQ